MTTGEWRPTEIEGVMERAVDARADVRGSFAELWRHGWTSEHVPGYFVQANLSRSRAGTLRGMHVHQRQTDLWVLVEGRAFVVLTDLRPTVTRSPTVLTRHATVGATFLIPPGVAHGFLCREDMALLYLVSNEYDGTDELGYRWDDRDAAIPWPMPDPILSDRDRDAPPLRDLLERIAQSGQSTGA